GEGTGGRGPNKQGVRVGVDQAWHERAPAAVDDGRLLRGRDVAADLLDLVADDEDGRARGELVRRAVEHLHVLEQGRARLFRIDLCGRLSFRSGPRRPVRYLLRPRSDVSGWRGEESEEPAGSQHQYDPHR